jgi:hypothetical protein
MDCDSIQVRVAGQKPSSNIPLDSITYTQLQDTVLVRYYYSSGGPVMPVITPYSDTATLAPQDTGSYVVKAVTYNNENPEDSITKSLAIQRLRPDFAVDTSSIFTYCAGDTMRFLNQTDPDMPYLDYTWRVNNIAIQTTKDFNFLVDTAAGLNVELLVASVTPGCRDSTDTAATAVPKPEVAIAIDQAACDGQANGRVIATASGGIAPYAYTWSTGAQGDTLANLAPGTYRLTVLDSQNCTARDTVELGPAPTPTPDFAIGNAGGVEGCFLVDESVNADSVHFSARALSGDSNLVITDTANVDTLILFDQTPTATEVQVRLEAFNQGCSATLIDTVFCGTSSRERADASEFKLYPNPARNQVHLEFQEPITAEVQLLDTKGRVVRSWSLQHQRQHTLSLGELPEGLYGLRILGQEASRAQRLLIR